MVFYPTKMSMSAGNGWCRGTNGSWAAKSSPTSESAAGGPEPSRPATRCRGHQAPRNSTAMYRLHQAQEDLLTHLRPFALGTADLLRTWDTARPGPLPLSPAAASLQLLETAGTTHRKPPFGLTHTRIGGRTAEVREEAVLAPPFCMLRRFANDVRR